jgi:hypothetical protein
MQLSAEPARSIMARGGCMPNTRPLEFPPGRLPSTRLAGRVTERSADYLRAVADVAQATVDRADPGEVWDGKTSRGRRSAMLRACSNASDSCSQSCSPRYARATTS